MILSDRDIRDRLEDGSLAIDPIADEALQIQPASVDLRLGREFLEFQHANIPCIHPNREQEVDHYISETLVEEGDDYVLHPGDFVLGTTVETVAIPDDLIAHVEGRSSLGRLAVVVHASLPYDEEVLLWTPEEGVGFYEIGAIVEEERQARALAFDPQTLAVSTHRVTDHITNPTKSIYRVRLASGRSVTVTRDHNLFTLDSWGGVSRLPSEDAEGTLVMVPDELPASPTVETEIDLLAYLDPGETVAYASDGGTLDVGDHGPAGADLPRAATPEDVDIGLVGETDRHPRSVAVTAELGWLLGYVAAAPGDTNDGRRRVSVADAAHGSRLETALDRLGCDSELADGETGITVTVESALWTRLLGALVGTGTGGQLPRALLNWPEETLVGVRQGLLDAAGRSQAGVETLYTTTEALADRAAYLGTRLGERTTLERVELADTPLDRAGEGWAVSFEAGATPSEAIPTPGALLAAYRERAALSRAGLAEGLAALTAEDVAAIERGERETVTTEQLGDLRAAFDRAGVSTDRLDQLLDGGVRFERVERVTETDRVEPTYDLEVQPGGRAIENFLGGRGGIFLSNTAGLCDPGYEGQITLELSNLGRAPVALMPGMRISQLTFTELSSPAERPYGEARGSKYQGQSGPQASRIDGDEEFGGDQG